MQKVANVGAGGAMGSGLAQVRAATGRAVSLCNEPTGQAVSGS